MIDLIEIYVHWYAGRSQAQIADSLGLDRKTVRKYLGPVTAAGLVPGGPPVMTEAQWRAKAASWFPAVVDKGLRQVSWPAIGAHRDYISAQLAAGVTVATIHQRLVDEHALVASVASVRRWVGGNLPEEARRAQVRVLRPGPVEPGSEAQIDYGRLGVWTDPATGRRHTVQAFVMVLACSRYMFVRPVLRMDQEAWTRCHVEAFAFFAGVPARLVLENVPRNILRAHPGRNAAEVLERQDVSLQERLLSLGAVRDVERPPAVRQAHHEHPHLHQRPADRGVELPEVDLRLRARLMGLRDERLNSDQVELDPAPGHIPRHAHLRQDGAVLGHQPLPHPPGRVPLLTMHVLVADQPCVDHTGPRVGRRPGPGHVLLTRRRQRGRQRLPHRAAVNLMSLGQLPNRQGLNAPVAPDLLEQLHS